MHNPVNEAGNADALSELLPKEPLLLMGAGPVPIAKSVAEANGIVINHIGKTMGKVITNLQSLARYVFQTYNEKIIGVAGPASAAMEMAIANLVWPGRRVLVITSGTFGERWAEIAERIGGDVVRLASNGIIPPTLKDVEEAFSKTDFDVVIITHGETSSGVIQKDLGEITQFAKSRSAISIVDAVTTLGVSEFHTDDWQVDVAVAGGQKGLGAIPGVSLISFSESAWEQLSNRETPPAQWVLDSSLAWQFWGDHQYHYTAPVPGILAMYAALELIKDETLETRWKRHYTASNALQKSVEAMGLELFTPEDIRLSSVIAIKVPEGVDSAKLRSHMAETFGVEISGAFGHNIIRIGQMGEQCRAQNLFKTVYALGISCKYHGAKVDLAKAMSVLEENLSIDPETYVV